ncbi:MAG TPA: hypothetical protein VH107_05500, partial [Lacipirellulaceae bacterium]|nr:hypothetical protein [Lacipirellulaceae bacterium]
MMFKPNWLGLIAPFLIACTALSTSAAPKNWAAGDGNWAVDNNWSPVGVPQSTDDANIVFTNGVARTVTIDATGPAQNPSSITLDLTGGTGASTLAITGNTLSDNTVTIGDNGNGAVTQSGGTHTVGYNLILSNQGTSVGTYTLSGGTLNSYYNEYVGSSGSGTFTQSGGTHSANYFFVGYNASGLGSYTLSGSSSLLQATYETIGQTATGNGAQNGGSFTQTGGANQMTDLFMGQDALSSGSYSLGGGSLTAQLTESIANNGTATFNQTNGTNSTQELDLGFGPTGNGSYIISGGGLQTSTINLGGSPYQVGGKGSLTINTNALVNVFYSINVYSTTGSGVVLQGGTLNVPNINVHGVPGLFKWTSGTLNITTDAVWDPAQGPNSTGAIFGSALNLNTGRNLNVTGNEVIGGTGAFQLTLAGGTHTVTGDIILKTGGIFSASISAPLNYTNFNQLGGIL